MTVGPISLSECSLHPSGKILDGDLLFDPSELGQLFELFSMSFCHSTDSSRAQKVTESFDLFELFLLLVGEKRLDGNDIEEPIIAFVSTFDEITMGEPHLVLAVAQKRRGCSTSSRSESFAVGDTSSGWVSRC